MIKIVHAVTVISLLIAFAILPAHAARLRSQVEAILGPVNSADTSGSFPQLNIVLVYGAHDHAAGQHEYQKFADEWQPLLSRMHNVVVSKANYWPSAGQWQTADLIVFHLRTHNCTSNTGAGPSCTAISGTGSVQVVDAGKLAQLDDFLTRGKGIVTVHPANYPHQMYQDSWADRTGLVWRVGGSTATNTTYREGLVTLNFRKTQNPEHPILTGLPDTLKFDDEVYYPLFGHPDSVTVLATSTETFQGVTTAHPALWTYSRPGSTGRSYGFIMGHLHESFSDPVFRILLLRGMAWAAKEPNFSRFRRVVLDSAQYVNDVVGIRAPSPAKPVIRAHEGGKAATFDWKGKPRQSDGRVPQIKK